MAVKAIAADSGSSFLKIYDGTAATPRLIPAVVRKLDASHHGIYTDEIIVDGEHYVVGNLALSTNHTTASEPYLDPDFHGSHDQYVQLCYGLGQLGAAGRYDELIISLPYQDSRRKDLCSRLRERSRFTWSNAHGETVVEFGEVGIVPQGVGALRMYQAQRKDEARHQIVCVVDIGSFTSDIVVVRYDESIEDYVYSEAACGSLRDVNVWSFWHMWHGHIKRRVAGMHDLNLGFHALMRAPMRNELFIEHNGRVVDVAESYSETRRRFTEDVRTALHQECRDIWPSISRFLVTGGGAALLDDTVWADRRVEKLDIWANVRGQMYSAAGYED